jgi:hypothetical protein
MTTAVYLLHVRTAGFVYEDLNDLNTTYRPWQGLLTELHDAAVRPSRALTRAVERTVGFDAVRQHAASLVLHLVAGMLVYALAVGLLAPWGATFAAAVFLLAPWQVEAVAYASARADILVTLAVLGGLVSVRAERLPLAWLCAGAAVLAKEAGIVAWILLPAWALWLGAEWPLAWIAGWTLTAAGGALVALTTRDGALAWPHPWLRLRELAALLLTPPWRLSIDPDLTATWPVWSCLLVTVLGQRVAPRWTLLVVGGVLLAWLPRLVLPLREGPHFHHLYLPAVALSLGAAALVTKGR